MGKKKRRRNRPGKDTVQYTFRDPRYTDPKSDRPGKPRTVSLKTTDPVLADQRKLALKAIIADPSQWMHPLTEDNVILMIWLGATKDRIIHEDGIELNLHSSVRSSSDSKPLYIGRNRKPSTRRLSKDGKVINHFPVDELKRQFADTIRQHEATIKSLQARCAALENENVNLRSKQTALEADLREYRKTAQKTVDRPIDELVTAYMNWFRMFGGKGSGKPNMDGANTKENYLNDWIELLSLSNLSDIQLAEVEKVVRKKAETPKEKGGWVAQNTQWNRVKALKAFINWCVERDYISRSPIEKISKWIKQDVSPKGDYTHRSLTEDEVTALQKVAVLPFPPTRGSRYVDFHLFPCGRTPSLFLPI